MLRKRNRWLAAGGLVLASICLGYLLTGRKDSDIAQANPGVTTDQAAARAGARVLPTDPQLKIEPK